MVLQIRSHTYGPPLPHNDDIISEHPQTIHPSEAYFVCESLAEIVSYSYSVVGGGGSVWNIQQL